MAVSAILAVGLGIGAASACSASWMAYCCGRGLGERDTPATPLVAVVNRTLADRYFHGQD
ncbi:MAG TPA: hypothetical protein VGS58_08040 [Candidatus Sulfopaludibacter sp.]|nr:hypothetical protein [Candidatus Sulfopaludibacter sp.]